MCLAVPGKIIDIYTSGGLRMGKIDFGGVLREACLESLPEAQVGEYTIVHAGFALSVLNEEDAQITLSALREIAALDEELGGDVEDAFNKRTIGE
ncbi:MAG: HypC/HybG/HupF family hydrogenase formation chaperone [Anaerolineaceae bacterium]|nr:HypC/HybG/HupF family hydrogenase formation chaperone [Anaerolineaceae bacterium]